MIQEEILSLLRSKNRCLERLIDATREFLKQPFERLVQETTSEPSPLAAYEEERTAVIRTLEMHDRKIGELITTLDSSERTGVFMEDVKSELLENERLIIGVVNADEIVFQRIRDAQNQITKLLAENRKSRELLSKFKSAAGSPTGEEMDCTL